MLSEPTEARAAALMSLAALAPGLSEAELRTALYLASIEDPIHHSATASSRQIAEATRLSRRNVQRALDSLTRRYLIVTRPGTAIRPAAYMLSFTRTTALQGGVTATPPPTQMHLTGVTATPPVSATLPPTTQSVASQRRHPSEPQPALDIPSSSIELIDRVLTAKKTDFPDDLITQARRAIHGYSVKLRGEHAKHPPDDRIVAQILTAAGGSILAIQGLIQDLWLDRTTPGDKYGWYLAVALQRWHGIRFSQVKARRAHLKLIVPTTRAAAEAADTQGHHEQAQWFRALIGDLAQKKAL